MTALQQFIYDLANTMHLWRDSAVTALAGLVIGCLYIYATALTD